MRTIDRVREVSPQPLNAKDKEMVRVAQRCIMASLDHSRAAAITLTTDTGEHPTVEVPPAALKLIGQLLGAMSEGRPIVLMPTEQEFTTVEAANFLNVARPFVIKEMEAGRPPHRKVGSHRRIALEDLLAYAQKMRAQQASVLDRLADNARELGLDTDGRARPLHGVAGLLACTPAAQGGKTLAKALSDRLWQAVATGRS